VLRHAAGHFASGNENGCSDRRAHRHYFAVGVNKICFTGCEHTKQGLALGECYDNGAIDGFVTLCLAYHTMLTNEIFKWLKGDLGRWFANRIEVLLVDQLGEFRSGDILTLVGIEDAEVEVLAHRCSHSVVAHPEREDEVGDHQQGDEGEDDMFVEGLH